MRASRARSVRSRATRSAESASAALEQVRDAGVEVVAAEAPQLDADREAEQHREREAGGGAGEAGARARPGANSSPNFRWSSVRWRPMASTSRC